MKFMINITDNEFIQLVTYIKNNYGINIREEKRALLTGRLSNTLINEGYKSFTEFYEALITDNSKETVTKLLNRITTNHTFFMREKDHFEFFKTDVLPFLKNNVKDYDLRIWCAACSTGEESYTLAMILDEYFEKDRFKWDKKILATDISEKVLNIAKQGIYSNEKVDLLPSTWKSKYFKTYDENSFIVKDEIKKEVIYRKLNLMESKYPFKQKLHVVFCRNVMIYFDYETKNNIIKKLYNVLEDDGYLFIGHSETVSNDFGFKYIKPAVYRKT